MLRELESLGVLGDVIQAPELHAQVPLNFNMASSTCPHAAFLRPAPARTAHYALACAAYLIAITPQRRTKDHATHRGSIFVPRRFHAERSKMIFWCDSCPPVLFLMLSFLLMGLCIVIDAYSLPWIHPSASEIRIKFG